MKKLTSTMTVSIWPVSDGWMVSIDAYDSKGNQLNKVKYDNNGSYYDIERPKLYVAYEHVYEVYSTVEGYFSGLFQITYYYQDELINEDILSEWEYEYLAGYLEDSEEI
jgi:hypothetical protein